MYLSVSYIVIFVITTLFINQIRGILLFMATSKNCFVGGLRNFTGNISVEKRNVAIKRVKSNA